MADEPPIDRPATPRYDLSVVVPAYNEVDNVRPLAEDIVREVDALGISYEVIFVDDGSADGTGPALDEMAGKYAQIKVIHFAGNYGQTAAMTAGIEAATGAVLVTMDGDRQNDPADIGPLLKTLNEGYGCVSGWRRDRQDNAIRRWPSKNREPHYQQGHVGSAARLRLHDQGLPPGRPRSVPTLR